MSARGFRCRVGRPAGFGFGVQRCVNEGPHPASGDSNVFRIFPIIGGAAVSTRADPFWIVCGSTKIGTEADIIPAEWLSPVTRRLVWRSIGIDTAVPAVQEGAHDPLV